jgi:NAD(P)-dependent dehydrogenase (short-subunit alcohol dehydrogenase family)
MGRACARELGRSLRLVVTDLDPARLEALAAGLTEEGYAVVAAVAGDLAEPGLADRLIGKAREQGGVRSVIHTAGLSPALAPWDAILTANLVATERLLRALEPQLEDGLAAVLLASMAGHMAARDAAIDALFADPLSPELLPAAAEALQPHVAPGDAYGLASPAYAQSKRAVIRMCEARAAAWGARGARLVSISPGTIWTPMGRAEAQANPGAARVVAATPAGRWGSPLDVSAAAAFLASDAAGFVTGCDLRVDGGVTPALRGAAF